MVTSLAPVEAGLADRPTWMRQRRGIYPQFFSNEPAALGREFDGLLGLPDQLPGPHAVEHLHAEIAGEMVVANPCATQCGFFWPGADAEMARTGCQTGQAFQHTGDIGAG